MTFASPPPSSSHSHTLPHTTTHPHPPHHAPPPPVTTLRPDRYGATTPALTLDAVASTASSSGTPPASHDGSSTPSPPSSPSPSLSPGSSPSSSALPRKSSPPPAARAPCKPFVLHPPSSVPEKFRDIGRLGSVVTLYRVLLLLWVGSVVTALFKLQDWIWPPDPDGSPYEGQWYATPAIGYILLTPLLSTALAFAGAIWFRFNPDLDDTPPTHHRVVFRIVSRGINNACLMETIRTCQAVMRRNSFFPYLVEVVTDAGVFEAPDEPDVLHLKVPEAYVTPKHTKFKARALHYATHASAVPGDAWVVHLDEETQPTSSAVKGIARFVAQCEASGDVKRVGQGCITYHRSWRQHRFLTLADMRRTGDDFGHFFLQHRLGIVLFGLHGAFVVCRADVEARVGFDVGPEGSITEDAWWALMAMARGCRFAWVDGFLAEQSTQSLADFVKQRRRWNYGLMKVAFLNPVRLRYRIAFSFFLVTWFVSPLLTPFQVAYVVVIAEHRLPITMGVRLLTLFILAMQTWTYFIGWIVNLREGMRVNWAMVPLWTVALVALYPVFQVIEVAALIASFFAGYTKDGRGFHVVQKSALTANQRAEERALLV